MKKQVLFIYVFTLSVLGYGQFNKYYKFPDSSASWTITSYYAVNCNNTNGSQSTQWDYYLKGDTIFNGKTYYKLRIAGGQETGPCTSTWYDYDDADGFIREDTVAKLIYYNPDGGGDSLLYTFNLNVGDTLPTTWNNNKNDINVVDSIDSVLIGTTYRRQFVIISHTHPVCHLIEGIGSTLGLLENIVTPGASGTTLNCFTQNHKTLYPDTNSACTIFYLGTPAIADIKPTFLLYPDPNNGRFTIQCSVASSQRSEIEIYNSLGQKVFSQLKIGNSQWTMDMSNNPSGIYLYRIISEQGQQVATGKFIVE